MFSPKFGGTRMMNPLLTEIMRKNQYLSYVFHSWVVKRNSNQFSSKVRKLLQTERLKTSENNNLYSHHQTLNVCFIFLYIYHPKLSKCRYLVAPCSSKVNAIFLKCHLFVTFIAGKNPIKNFATWCPSFSKRN